MQKRTEEDDLTHCAGTSILGSHQLEKVAYLSCARALFFLVDSHTLHTTSIIIVDVVVGAVVVASIAIITSTVITHTSAISTPIILDRAISTSDT